MSDWIGRKLVVRDVDGTLQPPAAGPGLRVIEPDGSDVTIVARGEHFDLYFAKSTVINVPITANAAMHLARWLVWWWVRHAWFGVKLRIWRWVQNSAMKRKWKADA